MNHSFSIPCYVITACLAFSGSVLHAQSTPKKAPANSLKSTDVAVLRVSCEGNSAGAQISTNGQAKGRCPIDMEVPVGTVKIRATKKEDDDFERVFEDEVELGSGVVQRVEVVLGGRGPSVALMKRWEAAANAGDAEAMYQLGFAYQWGTSGQIDFGKSTSYYGKAAEAGHPAGMSAYAGSIFVGRVLGKGDADGEKWAARAVEKGDGHALTSLGMKYFYGDGGRPPDFVKAKEIFLRAANAGNAIAWSYLSKLEKNQSKKLELQEFAARAKEREADRGDMDAMSSVANEYDYAQFEKSPAEAAEMRSKSKAAYSMVFSYWQKAAATGDTTSLVRLGNAYRDGGKGAPKNRSLAEKAFRAASEKGSSSARSELEKMLKE